MHLRSIRSKDELVTLTSISKTTINKLIKKLDEWEGEEDPSYEDFYVKRGRRIKDKSARYAEIRRVVCDDNSLTLRGCAAKLEYTVSIAQLSRDMKAAGFSRKRLKKRASIVLTDRIIEARRQFCAEVSGNLNHGFLVS